MRDTLYLQLRDAAPDAPLAYALVSAQPGAAAQVQRGTLDAILALAPGRRVVAFVPGSDVRLASVQVPARVAAKILQAAPFALEEQLAEDVDTLHFALGRPGAAASGGHPVAVVSKERMEAWLAPFKARSITPEAVLPETLSLPLPESGHWTGLAEAGRVTVRTGSWSGFACALDDLGACLQIADPDSQSSLRLFVARDAESDFSRAGRPVELLPGYASGLEVLARHWQPATSINLLQGAYSGRQDWQRVAAPWRTAGALAIAWLALGSAYAVADLWRTGSELKAQTARNFERCQQLFPSDCVSEQLMPAVVEQQDRLMHGGGARTPLFPLLASLDAAIAAVPGLTLESLQFRDGVLHLALTGGDLQALETLRAWYAARTDARLEVEAANAGTDGVQIRVKLSAP